MHAVLMMFTLGPGMRPTAEELCRRFAPSLRSMRGFRSATFICNDEIGEYGGLSVWESEDTAEAALETTGPRLEEALSGMGKVRLIHRKFEVWKVFEAD